MIQLDNKVVNKARVVRMNRNSLVLELQPNEEVLISRKVFNEIRRNPNMPMYSVIREHLGIESLWVAIPMTI